MGGAVIIVATLLGYFAAHLFSSERGPTASGLLLLYLLTGLGLVGFLDDFIKIRKQRSLGLRAAAKLVGQFVVGVVFAIAGAAVPGRRRAHARRRRKLSFVRDIPQIGLGRGRLRRCSPTS